MSECYPSPSPTTINFDTCYPVQQFVIAKSAIWKRRDLKNTNKIIDGSIKLNEELYAMLNTESTELESIKTFMFSFKNDTSTKYNYIINAYNYEDAIKVIKETGYKKFKWKPMDETCLDLECKSRYIVKFNKFLDKIEKSSLDLIHKSEYLNPINTTVRGFTHEFTS